MTNNRIFCTAILFVAQFGLTSCLDASQARGQRKQRSQSSQSFAGGSQCNGSGSVFKNGYSDKAECEGAWRLSCYLADNQCWIPEGKYLPGTPVPPAPSNSCTSSADSDGNDSLPRSLPNMLEIVKHVSSSNPGLIRKSCIEDGGNNEFLFKVVSELRKIDPRWGLNWKRGNYGDMSQDVVSYYRGAGPFGNGTDAYVVDIIGGHCGESPQPIWDDVTCYGQDCRSSEARWTIDPMQKCDSGIPNPDPTSTPTPLPPGPAGKCNASGSILNNGYPIERECRDSWRLSCYRAANQCWFPDGKGPGPDVSIDPTPVEGAKGDTLSRDQSINRDQSLRSSDGKVSLVLQGDGNLVLYRESSPLWASNTFSPTGHVVMQGDGNLVLYDGSGNPIWASNTSQHPGSKLQVMNDGTLVIIDSGGSVVWRR